MSDLEQEALIIHPIVVHCLDLYKNYLLSPSDFVGIFILSYLGLRRPKGWSNGRLKAPISSSFCSNDDITSISISKIPGLLEILDRAYVMKRMAGKTNVQKGLSIECDMSVLSVFDTLQLMGIKKNADNYVNRCIVNWAYGLRPCHLMFRIPNPMEVLTQQSSGTRVVTMFTSLHSLGKEHIAKLYYMEGMPNHSKDALEFLLHDLKHMENFIDIATYKEQVGFFRCMLKLSDVKVEALPSIATITSISPIEIESHVLPETAKNDRSPQPFFVDICGYDKHLWRELEYVISDMNCYSTHMMQYMLAKMLIATERLQDGDPGSVRVELEQRWRWLLEGA